MNIRNFSVCAAFALTAASVVSSFAADTRGYVQSGLIAHWDGVENAGRLTHDAAAAKWIDLVNGFGFALTDVTVNDDRLTFAGAATSFGLLSDEETALTFTKAGSAGTVEIVLKANSTGNAVAFQSPTTTIGRNSTRTTVYSGAGNKPMLDWCWDAVATNTVSLRYVNALVQNAAVNGTAISMAGSQSWSVSGSATTIGTRQSRANNHFNGSIYAIRLYDRQLTAAEIAQNAALDELRFGQGNANEYANAVFVVSSVASIGTVEPAYGLHADHVVGQEYTYAAPSCATNASGMFVYPCVGWELKQKDGTVTTNTSETVRNCTFTYEEELDGATLTWRWGSPVVRADTTIYADAEEGDDGYEGADIGSAGHPFKTLDAAHRAAVAYLEDHADGSALVSLAAGNYDLTTCITNVSGERIAGAGMSQTFVNVRNCPFPLNSSGRASDSFGIKLVADSNYLGDLCVTGLNYTVNFAPKPLWVAAGCVERVASCGHQGYYQAPGLGIYLLGGMARNCVFTNNYASGMYSVGLGAHVNGGELTDSLVAYNTGNDSRYGKGDGIYLKSGAVRRCISHHNGLRSGATGNIGDRGAGAMLEGGILENCLIYANRIPAATYGAGVHMTGGTVRFCTIYGNVSGDGTDTTGVSGLCQSGGSFYNNIVFGNAHAGGVVTGGTCVTNLLDAAIAGCSANINTQGKDPGFTDAANLDFTIASRASLAVEHAEPVAAVKTDIVGLKRAVKPTIGAYEYDSSKEEFGVSLQIQQATSLYGTPASAKVVLSGASAADVSIVWLVDGVAKAELANQVEIAVEGLAYGWHSLRVEVTRAAEMKHDEKQAALCVLPDRVYVNTTGCGKFPYVSAEDATNDLCVAMDALWQVDSHTSCVEIAAGTYGIDRQVLLKYPVVVTGAGRELTTITRKPELAVRGVYVNHAAARLADLTLSGLLNHGGLQLDAGTVTDCCVTNCTGDGDGKLGGGVQMIGGSLLNTEIVKCGLSSLHGDGGGIWMKDGLVSNCTIRACWCHCGTRLLDEDGGGMMVYMGKVIDTCVLDCEDSGSNTGTSPGVATIWDTSVRGTGPSDYPVFRNCLFAGNRGNVRAPLYLEVGIFENCTFVANRSQNGASGASLGYPAGGMNPTYPKFRNCVIWENGTDGPTLLTNTTFDHCCYPQATEGADGNTARDPKLRSARKLYAISSFGSCFRTGSVLDWMTDGATDLMGRPRTTLVGGEPKVDIGCHQVDNDPGLMLLVR